MSFASVKETGGLLLLFPELRFDANWYWRDNVRSLWYCLTVVIRISLSVSFSFEALILHSFESQIKVLIALFMYIFVVYQCWKLLLGEKEWTCWTCIFYFTYLERALRGLFSELMLFRSFLLMVSNITFKPRNLSDFQFSIRNFIQ